MSRLFFFYKVIVAKSRKCATDKWSDDKYVYYCDGICVASDSGYERGTEASCGIYACSCKADTDDMDRSKCKTDDKSSE